MYFGYGPALVQIRSGGILDAWIEKSSGYPLLDHLRGLTLYNGAIGSGGAQALGRSPHLSRLESLIVDRDDLDDDDCAALRRRFGEGVEFV